MANRESKSAVQTSRRRRNSIELIPPDLAKSPELDRLDSLTVVLFGDSASLQFDPENILLGEEKPCCKQAGTSRIVPLKREIAERHVSLINMIDLHETDLEDHLIDQLMKENDIHAFFFVVRLDQLTNDDQMGLEWLQRVFGDKVLQFVIILLTYEREEERDAIKDDLKKVPVLEQLLEKCGGRYQTCNKKINNQSEMRDLMNKIERLFSENKQQCYTGEMSNTILKQREELKNSERGSADGCTEPTVNKERMEDTPTSETGEKHAMPDIPLCDFRASGTCYRNVGDSWSFWDKW